jgi:hypothetical protein
VHECSCRLHSLMCPLFHKVPLVPHDKPAHQQPCVQHHSATGDACRCCRSRDDAVVCSHKSQLLIQTPFTDQRPGTTVSSGCQPPTNQPRTQCAFLVKWHAEQHNEVYITCSTQPGVGNPIQELTRGSLRGDTSKNISLSSEKSEYQAEKNPSAASIA